MKSQPLAYWSFADCFAYLDKYQLERHPLHEQVWELSSRQQAMQCLMLCKHNCRVYAVSMAQGLLTHRHCVAGLPQRRRCTQHHPCAGGHVVRVGRRAVRQVSGAAVQHTM